MYLIKILVNDYEQAEEVNELLQEGEANGLLDFPFTVRITEDLSPSDAKHNLFFEDVS